MNVEPRGIERANQSAACRKKEELRNERANQNAAFIKKEELRFERTNQNAAFRITYRRGK